MMYMSRSCLALYFFKPSLQIDALPHKPQAMGLSQACIMRVCRSCLALYFFKPSLQVQIPSTSSFQLPGAVLFQGSPANACNAAAMCKQLTFQLARTRHVLLGGDVFPCSGM